MENMEQKDHMMQGKTCKCGHHKVFPIIVILFGLEFLLAAVGVLTWSFVAVTWPILVIIVGFMKLMRCNCCAK